MLTLLLSTLAVLGVVQCHQHVTSHNQLIVAETAQPLDRFGYQMSIGGASRETLVVSTYTAAAVTRTRYLRGHPDASGGNVEVALHPNTVINDDADPYTDADGNKIDRSGSIYVYKQRSAAYMAALTNTQAVHRDATSTADTSGGSSDQGDNWWDKGWWHRQDRHTASSTATGEPSAQWLQQCRIRAPYYSYTEKFGSAVAITSPLVTGSGAASTTIAVGAECHDQQGVCSGAVYIFQEEGKGTSWMLAQKLLPPYQSAYQHFGSSIASANHARTIVTHTTSGGSATTTITDVEQEWLLVGSPRDPPTTRSDSSGNSGYVTFTGIGGVVYVYGRAASDDSATWTLTNILSVDTILNTPYGYSGAVSTTSTGLSGSHSGMGFGETTSMAAFTDETMAGTCSSSASASTSASMSTVLALTGAAGFYNGTAGSNVLTEVGAVYAYHFSCDTWSSDGVLPNPDQTSRYTYFGHAVALDTSGASSIRAVAYVSAHAGVGASGARTGTIHTFHRVCSGIATGTCWRHTQTLAPVATSGYGTRQFGYTISAHRGYLAVTAPLARVVTTAGTSGTGATYLYLHNSSGVHLVSTLSRAGTRQSSYATSDGFGQSVSLSNVPGTSDGSTGDTTSVTGVNVLVGADFGSASASESVSGAIYSYRAQHTGDALRYISAPASFTAWSTESYSNWEQFSLLFSDHPGDMTLLLLLLLICLITLVIGARQCIMRFTKHRLTVHKQSASWQTANTCIGSPSTPSESQTTQSHRGTCSNNSWHPKTFISLTSLILPQWGRRPMSSGSHNVVEDGSSSGNSRPPSGRSVPRQRRSPAGGEPSWSPRAERGTVELASASTPLFQLACGTETSVNTSGSDHDSSGLRHSQATVTSDSANYDADGSGDDDSGSNASVGGRLLQGTAVRL